MANHVCTHLQRELLRSLSLCILGHYGKGKDSRLVNLSTQHAAFRELEAFGKIATSERHRLFARYGETIDDGRAGPHAIDGGTVTRTGLFRLSESFLLRDFTVAPVSRSVIVTFSVPLVAFRYALLTSIS